FRVVLAPHFHYLLSDLEDPDLIIDAIYKETFPKNNFYIYENNLKKIKLENFTSIKRFKSYFLTQIKFANFCLGTRDRLSEREQLTYLEYSLPLKTLKRLFREDRLSINGIFEFLEREESFNKRFNESNRQTSYLNHRERKPLENKIY